MEEWHKTHDGSCVCGAGCCCIDGCVGACQGHNILEPVLEKQFNSESYGKRFTEFELSLRNIINFSSLEQYSDTPDFILATYLVSCLEAYNDAVRHREAWFGRPIGTK